MKRKHKSTAGASQATPSGDALQPVDKVWDVFTAALDLSVQTAEMIGTRRDEPTAYVVWLWNRWREEKPPPYPSMPVRFFTTRGIFSTVEELAGRARAGKRVAFIGTGDVLPRSRGNDRQPFVIHWVWDNDVPLAHPPFFQWVCRDVQQWADLTIVSRKLAELALMPGVLTISQQKEAMRLEPILSLPAPLLREFLGQPGDDIVCPVAWQRNIFGPTRRRIPEGFDFASLAAPVPDEEEFFGLLQQVLADFQRLTERRYAPVDAVGVQAAEVVILTAGGFYEPLQRRLGELSEAAGTKVGAIHLNLIHPFPGHLLAHHLKGKKLVVLLIPSRQDRAECLLRSLRLSFEKAFERGTIQGKSVPRELSRWPAYHQIHDRPRVLVVRQKGNRLNVDALAQALPGWLRRPFAAEGLQLPEFSGDPAEKTASGRGRRKNDRFTVLYRSETALWQGRIFATAIRRIVQADCRVVGPPLAHRAHIHLGRPGSIPMEETGPIDAIISPEWLFGQITEDLARLRKGGVLLLQGDAGEPERLWSHLPRSARRQLLDGHYRVYTIDAIAGARENPSGAEEAWMAWVYLGALLKIVFQHYEEYKWLAISEKQLKGVIKSLEANTSRALLYGWQQVRRVDPEEWEPFSEPIALTDEGPQIREPARDGEPSEKKLEARRFQAYLTFHFTGRRPREASQPFRNSSLIPVLLHPFRNLLNIRFHFPVCLVQDPDRSVRPLQDIFDDLIEQNRPDGEAGEQFRRDVLRLEKAIKQQIATGTRATLTRLWEMAAESILQEAPISPERKETLIQNWQTARRALRVDGLVLDCRPDAALLLYRHIWNVHRRLQVKSFADELDGYMVRLSDILKSDEQKSPEAVKPETLKASVGAAFQEDLDFEQLSHILEATAAEGESLSPRRRWRIRATLATLKKYRPLFYPEPLPAESQEDIWNENGSFFPIVAPDTVDNLARALGAYEAQMHNVVEFFRAVHIARLEVENRYREDRHDAFFRDFTFEYLTREERRLMPPLLIYLRAELLNELNREMVLEWLSTDYPVKIMLEVQDLWDGATSVQETPCLSNWALRIARMAIGLNRAYVFQASIANVEALQKALWEGLAYSGPALWSVWIGRPQWYPALSPYLVAAAAQEARGFPVLTFNPSAGDTWADCFSLEGNPDPESDWPETEFSYKGRDGETLTQKLPFTFVDWLSTHMLFRHHFLVLPPGIQDSRFIPLAEYWRLSEEERLQRVPYILMVDEGRCLQRVVITRPMVEAARMVLADWHMLQEMGGIRNSHALRLLEVERSRLRREMEAEVQAIEQRFRSEMEKTLGEVARDIVSNIAAGLLGQAAGPVAPLAGLPQEVEAPPEMPSPSSEETAEAEASAEAAVEEEEEALRFDDPFIETPRCTSCGECITINNRLFAYNDNKQAYIADPDAGSYRELVLAAEKCPVHIIHPGKPRNPDEPGLDELVKRAEPYL